MIFIPITRPGINLPGFPGANFEKMRRNYAKKSLRRANNSPPQKTTTPLPEIPTENSSAGVNDSRNTSLTGRAANPSVLVGLKVDPSTAKDKYERARGLYAKWKYEDTREVVEVLDLTHKEEMRMERSYLRRRVTHGQEFKMERSYT